MEKENLTIEDKLYEIEKNKIRKFYIERFLDKTEINSMMVSVGTNYITLNEEDKELKKLIQDYYKKEVEKINERLNSLVK